MGQASRNWKTRADPTRISLGNFGSAIGATVAAAGQAARRAVQPQMGAQPPIRASLPVPDPSVHFMGYQAGKPKNPSDDINDAIEQAYASITGTVKKVNSAATGFKHDDPWEQSQSLDVAIRGKGAVKHITDITRGLGNFARDKDYVAPDRPDTEILDQLKKDVFSALSDNTWTQDERAAIVKKYRQFYDKFTASDDSVREINNFSVQSEFRRLQQQARVAADGSDKKASLDDDFSHTYDGVLGSASDDEYAQGFVISQDEDGFFFVTRIKDLSHQLESQMRKDPVAAGKLMQRLAAWGAYAAGTDKYVADRIIRDKNGNPVKGHWTIDDTNALKTALADMAKQQETATSGAELQPWDVILDQVAETQGQVAAAPAYGGGAGGGGYRGGGYGGGGGGGGGVTYTDADQLKQLINGIARSRLGYVLNDAQIAEFVSTYHQKEAAFVQARVAGQNGMQLDPESQAAAWLESHFRDEMGAQQGNVYVSALANFLMGGSFGSSS